MPSTMTAYRALLLALLLSAHAPAQTAEDASSVERPESALPTRIVFVASPGMDQLAERFAAELRSLHFEVIRAPDTEGLVAAGQLEGLAVQRSARAAVRVAVTEGAIDLWLVNATTHEVVYRRIVSERDPAVAVLRSLEILRGSLVDVRAMAADPAEPEPKPPAVVDAKLPPAPAPQPAPQRAVWCGVSGAGIAVAGTDLALGALAALHYALSPHLSLHTEGLVPLDEWQVEGEAGRVHAWVATLGLAATLAPWGERTVTPAVGAGVAALALHTRGEASPGFRGESDVNLSVYPHGRMDLTVKFGSNLRGRAQILAGVVTPRPVLLLAEQRNDSWFNPILMGAVGLEISLR